MDNTTTSQEEQATFPMISRVITEELPLHQGLGEEMPRHNNDFPSQYREIRIIPTADELNKSVPLSLLLKRISINNGAEGMEERKLDRMFRLLRADMISSVDSELKSQFNSSRLRGIDRSLFDGPRFVDIVYREKEGASLLFDFEVPSDLRRTVQGLSQEQRIRFFKEDGECVLSRDSILAFISHSNSSYGKSRHPHVECVGVITRRLDWEFPQGTGALRVGVTFPSQDLKKILSILFNDDNDTIFKRRRSIHLSVFQASTSFFSYKPVLDRLQSSRHISFVDEFVLNRASPDHTSHSTIPEAIKLKLSSDLSQLIAVDHALKHRVALIQGPPGTGKTFCGVQLIRTVLVNNPQHRVLVLTQSNHALDEFLLSLHEEGMDLGRVVRLGRSPKMHDKISLCRFDSLPEMDLPSTQSDRLADLIEKLDALSRELDAKKQSLSSSGSGWGHKDWRVVKEFLRSGDAACVEAWNELKFPSFDDPRVAVGDEREKELLLQNNVDSEFWEEFLFQRWLEGAERETEFSRFIPPYGQQSIWALERKEREQLVRLWRRHWWVKEINQIAHFMETIDAVDSEITLLRDMTKVPAAREASVIGCTVIAAVKYHELLAQIQPTVVIIEEAAEILEANVLTALGDSVQQCFMIGDHKQLRPKLETYDLRQESGKGVDFDVSLFERLANQSKFPVHTLKVQHRMRPEISALIRATTYPDLLDAESVRNRPDIRGLTSNLVFVSHNKYEERSKENVFGSTSKMNLYEANMVLYTLRYLLQQGYKHSDITILTPYLAQLVQIRNALRQDTIGVSIGDLDYVDLKRLNAGYDRDCWSSRPMEGEDGEAEKTAADTVRVATIDNFQGEESLIVIGSLVRSNRERDIGFMSGAERVNVLLSRARDGLILLGNEDTFRNARSARGRALWTHVLDLFAADGNIFPGLPVRCENHDSSPPQPLCRAADFLRYAADGGCEEPCGFVLPSCPLQHTCLLRCHPCDLASLDCSSLTTDERRTLVHRNIPCHRIVQEQCPATRHLSMRKAHLVNRVCSDVLAQPCTVAVLKRCPQGHEETRICGSTASAAACSVCEGLSKDHAAVDKDVGGQSTEDRSEKRDKRPSRNFMDRLMKDCSSLAEKFQVDRIQGGTPSARPPEGPVGKGRKRTMSSDSRDGSAGRKRPSVVPQHHYGEHRSNDRDRQGKVSQTIRYI